ncbi:hypothetical protein DICPUDRAFT_6215, partial [Dictyostelium purpureum]
MSYLDIRKLAKSHDIKANGKRDEIVERLVEFFEKGEVSNKKEEKEVSTKFTGKRTTRDESDTEEEKEEKEVSNKKQKTEIKKEKVEEKEEEEEDDNDTATASTASASATTTTKTTKSASNGADKLVGPFPQNDYELKQWVRDGTITFYVGEEINRSKIAGFDMDSTLIETKSGRVFATDCNDWVWWDPSVPNNLRKLYKDGYQVIIITNQGGIGGGSKFDQSKYNSITKKICILEKELGFPLVAIAACADDANRKPSNKMWLKLRELTDGKVIINESESFYCGDAAGRPTGWKAGKKEDFSSSDFGFALSSGIRFETPETHFLGEEHFKSASGGDAISDLIPKAETTGVPFDVKSITSDDFEIVISVGFPASGKSTFAKKYFGPANYVIINQDTLKTKDKCIKAAKEALSQGKSCIIDNTNYDINTRAEYLSLAKQYKAKARCLRFTTPRDLAEHLNYYRERTQNIAHIPGIGYNIFAKNLTEPTTKEGFVSVTPIKFILDLKESDKPMYYIPNPKA